MPHSALWNSGKKQNVESDGGPQGRNPSCLKSQAAEDVQGSSLIYCLCGAEKRSTKIRTHICIFNIYKHQVVAV